MRTLLLTALLCAATLPAADIAGTWLGHIPTTTAVGGDRGTFQEVAFQFVQKGTTLTGKFYGDNEAAPIIEGKVSGDQIEFVVIAQEQQGNQITATKLRFTGTVQKDGEIEITRVRESATNAGNGGTYNFKADNSKKTFGLKRLF
jgi:hypothetical protein